MRSGRDQFRVGKELLSFRRLGDEVLEFGANLSEVVVSGGSETAVLKFDDRLA